MPTGHQPAPLRPDTMMSRAAPDASRPRALFADDRSRYVAYQDSTADLQADIVFLSGDEQRESMCRRPADCTHAPPGSACKSWFMPLL
jgi:hypothetical protein